MIFLLKFFAQHLNETGKGCRVCVDGSKKNDSLPRKVTEWKAITTVKDAFAEPQKHCKDNHSKFLNAMHGLLLIDFPDQSTRTIPDLKFDKVRTALQKHSVKVGTNKKNTGCEMDFSDCQRYLFLRTASTAQQKAKSYFMYDPSFHTDKDKRNYFDASNIMGEMVQATAIGRLFVDPAKCHV